MADAALSVILQAALMLLISCLSLMSRILVIRLSSTTRTPWTFMGPSEKTFLAFLSLRTVERASLKVL